MATIILDLTSLKCPLPALKTRKALKSLKPGDQLQVRCTDPLSVIDIPALIRETGDRVEVTRPPEGDIVFLISKAGDNPSQARIVEPGDAEANSRHDTLRDDAARTLETP